MKILILVGTKLNRFNHRINYGFIQKLSNFSDVQLEMHDRISMVRQKQNIKQIFERSKPDVLICYCHAGKLARLGLAEYSSKISCPKIMIDVDYSYNPLGLQQIYKNNKFDLILQRGSFPSPPNYPIPWAWLPFSADEKVFVPAKRFKRRINLIGFGGSVNRSYPVRSHAINLLRRSNLLSVCNSCYGDKYYNFLRSYRAYLTSTEFARTNLYTPRGKMFEIISSRGLVLSNGFNSESNLGFDNCFVKYNHDCSDIIEKAKMIVTNLKFSLDMSTRAYTVFLQKHTDDIRIKELYDHIQNLIHGKPLVKPWGI
jgi:hypothetical protein